MEVGIEMLPKFFARKFRASFVTAIRGMECDPADLQIFCGQNPGIVMSTRYDKPLIESLGRIAGLAEGMVGAET